MKNNKLLFYILFLVVISSINLSLSAPYQTNPITNQEIGKGMESGVDFVKTVGDGLSPLFEWILGNAETEELGLESDILIRIVFFSVILGLLWITLSNIELFNEKRPVLSILSIGLSLIITRGIFAIGVLREILMPYNVLGVTLITVIPFIVFFIFVERGLQGTSNRVIRKILWVFYSVVFFAMLISLYRAKSQYAWVYSLVVVLSILMFIFDGTIQKIFNKVKVDKMKGTHNVKMLEHYDKLKIELTQKYKNFEAAGTPNSYTRHFAPTSKIKGYPAFEKDLIDIDKKMSKLS
ncbi:MAG: hypothetical protein WC260_03260 [Candidatus Pacearchaeota archaeon]